MIMLEFEPAPVPVRWAASGFKVLFQETLKLNLISRTDKDKTRFSGTSTNRAVAKRRGFRTSGDEKSGCQTSMIKKTSKATKSLVEKRPVTK
jgi:hypothetical protein